MYDVFLPWVDGAIDLSKYPTSQACLDALFPASFAVKADKTSFSVEAAVARTVRFTMCGTREVYCTDAMALIEFLAQTATDRKKPPLSQLGRWMKSMSEEQAKAFMAFDDKKHGIFHATLGPCDALMLPTGYISAERVGKADVLGVRFAIVKPGDLPKLDVWCKHFISQQCPNAVLHELVDALTLLE